MAYIQAEVKLPEVGQTITTQLYFPNDLPKTVGCEVQGVITLLHGYTNTGADWMMLTAACRYAADNGYILVAPNAGNSFYTDMYNGIPYYTALTELLPARLHTMFQIPTEREKNYIAGLSMGGYGALRIGLLHPERYAAIGSFSGSLDLSMMAQAAKTDSAVAAIFQPVLGENFALPPDTDLMELAQKTAALPKEKRPRIFCTCGKQDDDFAKIYAQNQNFRHVAESLSLDYTYAEWDGVHEWNFWDRSLAEFIGFVKNDDYAQRKRADWCAPINSMN